MDQVEVFTKAIDQTGRIVGGVRSEQLGEATPCADWDVRALLNHTIAVTQAFAAGVTGAQPDMSAFERDVAGDAPAVAYDKAAAELKANLARPGVLDGTWHMPFGQVPGTMAVGVAILEMFGHGWDIAKATGQQVDFDPAVTEAADAVAKGMPSEMVRQPGVFGDEAPCPPDAPAHDKLAAYLGRQI